MGKKYTTILTLFVIICFLLSGCDRDEGQNTGYGTMSLQVSANANVIELKPHANTRSNNSTDSVVHTRVEEERDFVPDAGDFKIALYKETSAKANTKTKTSKAGILQYEWNSLNEFDPSSKIAIGAYTLKATYGELNKEGFDAACYSGETDIIIQDHQNTPAEVTCYLNNVKVNVECSETVKAYFTSFEIKVYSQALKEIEISKNEKRPLYMLPGSLTVRAHFVKQNGKEGTVELARIEETEARQHYIIQVDLNDGNAGGAILNVNYAKVKSEETVNIDLSDEALNTAAPIFTATCLDVYEGHLITLREGVASDLKEPVKITLNARAGINRCILNINSKFLQSKGIPEEVDLAAQDEKSASHKALLEEYGLRIVGLDASKDKMALIDFTNLITMLQYVEDWEKDTYTLNATDLLGKVTTDPVKFQVQARSNQFALMTDAKEVLIGSTESETTVSLDGTENDINQVTFQYSEDEGQTWKSAKAEFIEQETGTINYRVKIKELEPVNKKLQIRAWYGSKCSETKVLNYYIPKFRIEPIEEEIWAWKAALKVVAESGDEKETEAITKYISWSSTAGVNADGVQKYAINGLKASTEYTVNAICNEEKSEKINFFTEGGELNDILYWDSENNWKSTIIKDFHIGGSHSCVPKHWSNTYHTKNLQIYEPSNWCTVNDKTMHIGYGEENTWYTVSSTDRVSGYNAKYGICLRNVAWDNQGKSISNSFASVTSCEFENMQKLNSPKDDGNSISYKSAGRLFLGNYTYDHNTNTELYEEGIEFTSRPSALSFTYKYEPYGSDKGYVKVVLEKRNVDGTVTILANAYKEFSEQKEYVDNTNNKIKLTYNKDYKYGISCPKATHLKLMFCASIKGINLLQSEETININLPDINLCKSEATVIGSKFYIENIKFEYKND